MRKAGTEDKGVSSFRNPVSAFRFPVSGFLESAHSLARRSFNEGGLIHPSSFLLARLARSFLVPSHFRASDFSHLTFSRL